jgi:3-oxoacyl-[acyl-carrier-protein] synthase II
MNKKRIVITGIGVVAPNGIGKDAYWDALKQGRSGIKAITRFDTNQFNAKLAGEITDFKAEEHLGPKGLKTLDRTTRFLSAASKMALEDSKFEINDTSCDEIGVCTGTTLSSLWAIAEFERQVIQDGPQFTDVALFPGTVANAASSYVSIRFNIQGFNTTVSNGYTSGLDALQYGVDFIRFGKAKAVLVGAVESMSVATFTGFTVLDFLAGSKGEEVCCPFDKRRNGIILGEAAATILLEDEESAAERNAHIYGVISGSGSYFDAYKAGKYQPQAKGLKESMLCALATSSLQPKDIDYISAAANSVTQQDVLETKAIKEVFGKHAAKIPVSAIKSMIGESFSASALLQLVAGIGNMRYNFISPTLNYHVQDPECDLDYVPNKARQAKINNILINNFGPGGNNASVILSQYN